MSAFKAWTKKEIKVSTADWNQNDPSANSYVKNRPFYEENGIIYKLDPKYLPDNMAITDDIEGKMDKIDPSGFGSLSINRTSDSAIGQYSIALGNEVSSERKAQFVGGEYNIKEPGYSLKEKFVSGYESLFRAKDYIYVSDSIEIDNKTGTFSLITPTKHDASVDLSINEGKYCAPSDKELSTVYHAGMYGISYNPSTKWVYVNNRCQASICTLVDQTSNRGSYVSIVGNGTSNEERSNAYTLDWEGNAWYQGDVYVGSTSGTNKDEGSKKLATEEYVDAAINGIGIPEGGFVSYSEAQALTDEQKAQARANISELVWRTLKNTNAKMPTKLAAYNQYGKNGFDWDKSDTLMSPTEWGKENNLTAFEDLLECLAATLSAEMFAEVMGDCAMNIDALIAAGVFDRYGVTFIRDVGGQIYKWLIFINDSAGKYSISLFDERGGSTYIAFNTTTNTVDIFQKWYALDKTLTQDYGYAGAKATGDAIKNLSDSLSAVATSGDYNDLANKPEKGVDYFTPAEVEEIARQAAGLVEVPEGSSPEWVPLIDVTLEEPAVYVSADVDINGKPFSVKEIYYVVKIIKEPDNTNARYIGVGIPNNLGIAVRGVSLMLDVKTDNVLHGLITLCGTQLRSVSSYKGSNEYEANGRGPYGGVLNGSDIGVTEMTNISVGFTSSAHQMLAGSIVKVWGR